MTAPAQLALFGAAKPAPPIEPAPPIPQADFTVADVEARIIAGDKTAIPIFWRLERRRLIRCWPDGTQTKYSIPFPPPTGSVLSNIASIEATIAAWKPNWSIHLAATIQTPLGISIDWVFDKSTQSMCFIVKHANRVVRFSGDDDGRQAAEYAAEIAGEAAWMMLNDTARLNHPSYWTMTGPYPDTSPAEANHHSEPSETRPGRKNRR